MLWSDRCCVRVSVPLERVVLDGRMSSSSSLIRRH